ncbi:MAG: Cation transporting ATPase, C-terminus, partial [Methanohalophilus sp.]|nr:Cation transporting ATPase, C-terminus [Methanohalophilus sp.]
VLATIGLQILAVYTPFLQMMLSTVPLAFGDWLMLFVIGMPLLVAGEAYKNVKKRWYEI